MIFEIYVHNLLTIAWFLQPSMHFRELVCQRRREQAAACPAAEIVKPDTVTEVPAEGRPRYDVSRRRIAEAFAVACGYYV